LQREKQTILVTGGAGFIGGNFVLDAVGDFEVVNLDALTYGTLTTSSYTGGSGTGNWSTACSPSIVPLPSSTSPQRPTWIAP
jgi:nucleoside-diphosphate-sugar epimerase